MQAGERIARGELIGREVEVYGTETKGKIIDETKNMILIEVHDGKRKKAVKKNSIFIFKTEGKKVKIEGSIIASRPEDRISMRLPLRWKAEISD